MRTRSIVSLAVLAFTGGLFLGRQQGHREPEPEPEKVPMEMVKPRAPVAESPAVLKETCVCVETTTNARQDYKGNNLMRATALVTNEGFPKVYLNVEDTRDMKFVQGRKYEVTVVEKPAVVEAEKP